MILSKKLTQYIKDKKNYEHDKSNKKKRQERTGYVG